MPKFSEVNELSSSLVFDKRQLKRTETEKFITPPSTLLPDTKVSPADSSQENNQQRLLIDPAL